ncbi:MAG: shikimate dehydrogenase [Desulfobacterales bacterium]|nr:shikimate dehydrogenase [Desulfobacterales bacterium]
MICTAITSETTDQAIADMRRASRFADLLEIRVDYINNPDLKKIIAAREKPLIITITPQHERGKFTGSEEERCALLREAMALGADYVDVGLDCPHLPSLLKEKKETRVIVSHHDYEKTPDDLQGIYERIRSTGADVIKIAAFANTLGDNTRILDLIEKSDQDVIAICMGPKGEISRILAPLYGSFLTFASLETGRESAPGQIPAETMREVYRLPELKPGFKIYGLVGNPVSKSKGYILHNRLFKQYGVNAVYLNFLVDDPDDFFENLAPRLAGFSVTMPHKQGVMKHLDEIDPMAKKIEAINTVVNRDGRLIGSNTDLAGIVRPILKRTPIDAKRVTILGAGGAARAAAAGMMAEGGRVTVLNRSVEKARAISEEFKCGFGAMKFFERIDTDILINMTSVGMHPDVESSPVETAALRDMVVMDGIYNPAFTRLLKDARDQGCAVISGVEMFVAQAAEQFRLWTGHSPETDFMMEILR